MTDKIQAMADHVIIVRPKPPEKTEGGIALPQQAKVEPQYGKVLAIGPGVKDRELDGRIVIFNPKGGWQLQISANQTLDLWWMHEDSLILSLPVGEAKKRGFDIPKETLDDLLRL